MCILPPVLVAVRGVCSRGPFVELCPLIAEDKAYIEVGRLILDQKMFLSILDCPNPLGLDVDKAAVFLRQLKVWGVLGIPLRDDVRDLVSLKQNRQSCLGYLISDLSFKARPITMLNADTLATTLSSRSHHLADYRRLDHHYRS